MVTDYLRMLISGDRESVSALRHLSPRLRPLCSREPAEALAEITRLRKWASTLRGPQTRAAMTLWLNWFERKALMAIMQAARRANEETARAALQNLPVKGTYYRGVL